MKYQSFWSMACVAVSLIATSAAGARTVEQVDPACLTRGQTFASEIAAASVLGACYGRQSALEDREYMAAILQSDAGFRFVVMPGQRARDRIEIRFKRQKGERLVALWHTHGARGAFRELFSPTDTALVVKVGVPFYLTDPKGDLKIFRPGDRLRARTARSVDRPPRGLAGGTRIES